MSFERSKSFESDGSSAGIGASIFSDFSEVSADFVFRPLFDFSPIFVFGLEVSFGEVSSESSSAGLRLLIADLTSFLSFVFASFLVISGVKRQTVKSVIQ